MISIIISSGNSTLLKQVSENIALTIGVAYEIIATDNHNAEKGICQIYNEAAQKAQYDILCFMHEDIAIQTNNWGSILISIFKNHSKVGLVGIAGSSYKSLAPSGWVNYGVEKSLHYNIVQHFKFKDEQEILQCHNPKNESLSKVVCVDGVWFCTRKNIVKKFPFDEHLLKGFHGYDIDFSLAVNQEYDVVVTYDILLDHFSEGKFEEEWINETIKISNKWKKILPLNVGGLDAKEIVKTEVKTYRNIIGQLLQHNLPLTAYRKYLWNYIRMRPRGLVIFSKLVFYLVKQQLKRP
jgi:hypothetical protein